MCLMQQRGSFSRDRGSATSAKPPTLEANSNLLKSFIASDDDFLGKLVHLPGYTPRDKSLSWCRPEHAQKRLIK